MTEAYLNHVATAVPPFDVHDKFVEYAPSLLPDDRSRRLFRRMVERAQIEHRFSFVEPHPSSDVLDRAGLFQRGGFADTSARMQFFASHAGVLAEQAVGRLGDRLRPETISHLIVTTCTGMYAPGIDLEIVARWGLCPGVERVVIGFMGCQAALPGLKVARHIVRSQPTARVLMVNLELCTLHMQETSDLASVLSFLLFADGCAASVVSAEPEGLAMLGFATALLPDSGDQITWRVGNQGFLMWLDGAVPGTIARGLPGAAHTLLGGSHAQEVELWAVHPGGRSILDATQEGLKLADAALADSRAVLRAYGNMSSPSVMFVLARILSQSHPMRRGCAVAFGPGLTAEAMTFATVGEGSGG
ncbi:MAG: type III polyketide synthase [Geminicoccaceae bacterium]